MPGCSVKDCKNSSAKGLRLFAIPTGERNKSRTQLWIKLINQDNLLATAKICEVHFSDYQFETARADGKRKLTPNAYPDLLENSKRKISVSVNPDSEAIVSEECRTSLQKTPDYQHPDEEIDENDPEMEAINLRVNRCNDIIQLKRQLKSALQKCRRYQKQKEKKEEHPRNLDTIFNSDQLSFLANNNQRGFSWSDDTIRKAFKLYLACGTKGYEEIRNQHLPYPSIRTLQHRIRKLKFKPGILDEVYGLLSLKVETFESHEKHATLFVDEMAIKPGLQYDNTLCSVVGRPTMKNAKGETAEEEVATHAMVFMLAGISTRWKQIVAYDFTCDSFSVNELYDRIIEIIRRSHSLDIKIRVIINDVSGQNRSLYKKLAIVATRYSRIVNSIQHPCLSDEKLYFMPDPVHIFKNLAAAITKGHKIILTPTIVDKYALPSSEVTIQPIQELYDIENGPDGDVIKLCPGLRDKVLHPSHFDKMNVGLSCALLNHGVAKGIMHYISTNRIKEIHRTTAWFVEIMHKWFKYMTGRYSSVALSHFKEDEYEALINFLHSVQELTCNMSVNNQWMPFQSGILLATQTALDVHKIYLDEEKFDYVLLGRFTQDALENSFSSLRSRNSCPDAHLFKVSLRLLCLSQFETDARKSSYTQDESAYIIKYCKELEDADQNSPLSVETSMISSIYYQFEEVDLTNDVQSGLYYLLGCVINKVRHNLSVCDSCYKQVVMSYDANIPLHNFIKSKEFKENLLTYPKLHLFDLIVNVEKLFRVFEKDIIANKISSDDFIMLSKNKIVFPSHPECHNIINKIVSIFVKSRLFFSLRQINKSCILKDTKSSRSIAMRAAIN